MIIAEIMYIEPVLQTPTSAVKIWCGVNNIKVAFFANDNRQRKTNFAVRH